MMLVSYKWLKDYVDVNVAPDELASRLTMAGIAVESVQPFSEGVTGVVAGYLDSVRPHPDSDHLQICEVTVGGGRTVTVVTGATNVRAGQTVPVALPGSTLAGGARIETTVFRGVQSDGMLCSASELGISDKENDGILILPEPIAPGTDLAGPLGLDDYLLELDLTTNRSDCLCMLGVAKEVAAILRLSFRTPRINVPESGPAAGDLAGVVVLDPDNCRRYVGRVLTEVKIFDSPLWIQQRLRAAGMRPINNVVDVTNYVMLEMNQPLHAFDYDLLADHRIVVRRGTPGEVLKTLDGQDRTLEPTDLVIADGARGVAIAGVMGGANTEVSEGTTRILLESASFHPTAVRRTARRLGLRSEASLRFEKGVDTSGADAAIDRAAQLLAEMGAVKVASGRIDVYPVPVQNRAITLRSRRVNDILGTHLTETEVKEILAHLPGVSAELTEANGGGGTLTVAVPSYRQDLNEEIDLVEEVARLYGYNVIPSTLPQGISSGSPLTAIQRLERDVRTYMIAAGLTEVVTTSLTNQRALDNWLIPDGSPLRRAVKLMDPLTEDLAEMRTSLLPSLMDVVVRNVSRRQTDLQVFEVGPVFLSREDEQLPDEPLMLAGMLVGAIEGGEWTRPARQADFYDLKGIVGGLLAKLGVENWTVERAGRPWSHPGRAARIVVDGREVGTLAEVHPRVAAAYGLATSPLVFEVDLKALVPSLGGLVTFEPLPRYPAVNRDLAIVVADEVPAGELLAIARNEGGELVEDVRLFDVYRGPQVGEGRKNLALSITYRANDRTLTDAEVSVATERIATALATRSSGKLRA